MFSYDKNDEFIATNPSDKELKVYIGDNLKELDAVALNKIMYQLVMQIAHYNLTGQLANYNHLTDETTAAAIEILSVF